MLSLTLNVSLLAHLECSEDELVAGLCAKLRTLAADPERVRAEMQGGLTLTAATPEEWRQQSIDVLERSESAPESDSGLKSSLPPAGGVQKGTCVGPCGHSAPAAAESQPVLICGIPLDLLLRKATAGQLKAVNFRLLMDAWQQITPQPEVKA